MNSPTTSGTILVVDDCEALCELIEVLLCRIGYRVLTATNGDDALQLARTTRGIDVLVSHVEMPGMRGDELATRFAAVHPASAIVLLSSSIEPIANAEPFELLEKPFTLAELRDSVRRALRARPARAEELNAA